jgi:beta-galactosidase
MKIKGFLSLIMLVMLASCATKDAVERVADFNADWLFILDSTVDASARDFDDSSWEEVDLPHDWSVSFPFDSVNGEGCTAYLPGGLGWYRKHFEIKADPDDKVFIHFDGVYNNSQYWINGEYLGEHPYGYSPFYFDLTPYLSEDGNNVLAVKVDRTRYADSRWYSGSGIYRNVEIIKTKKLYIPVWGVFVTTPDVQKSEAGIRVSVQVKNEYDEDREFTLQTRILDANEEEVATLEDELSVKAGVSTMVIQDIQVTNPKLWSIDKPNMYKAVSTIHVKKEILDTYITDFGIRSFRFDPDEGFFLNGENLKIKGVCLHHDGGLTGAAVPRDVWKRRLSILKEGGCNAIRSAHNPASEEFLDLCDEMGFLVQDEFFDEWDYPKDKRLNQWERHDDYISRGYTEHFQEWAKKDLQETMLAHRNHPSIIQWSIGNEIEWTYPRNRMSTGYFNNMNWQGNYFWSQPPFTPGEIRKTYNELEALEYAIGPTAQKLADWTREMDTTRPVTANCILPSASFETGFADALDVVGFSYRRVMYDYAKKYYPEKVVMGTENLPQWHDWKAIEERDFVSGLFLWTGIDYMGESHDDWPKKATNSGLLDQAGFKKPSFHLYKTLWTEYPHVYISSNPASRSIFRIASDGRIEEKRPGAWETRTWFWHPVNEHWNYQPGEMTIVEVLSNCPEVELFLNGTSLGKKQLDEFPDRIMKWAVPFEPGELVAKGSIGNKNTEYKVATALDPNKVLLNSDVDEIPADNYSVVHLLVQLIDENGVPVLHADRKLEFEIQGPVKMLGVDNGWERNVQTFQHNEIITHKGKALCIIQAGTGTGVAKIRVKGEGLLPATTEIEIN